MQVFLFFAVLVGSVFSAPAESESDCGCLAWKYTGRFDFKIETSSYLDEPLNFTNTRYAGFYDIDVPNKYVFFKIWNADFVTGKKDKFVFDITADLNTLHLQIVPEGGEDCLNAEVDSRQSEILKDLFKQNTGNPGEVSRFWCAIRDYATKKTVGDSVVFVFPEEKGYASYDAKTCLLSELSIGTPGSYRLKFKEDRSGNYPQPGVCPKPPTKYEDLDFNLLTKLLLRLLPADRLNDDQLKQLLGMSKIIMSMRGR
ncbi:uncharacterized protein LOC141904263 [Tubulanus polymorphus]|uniref:uncharacterized protein LOC141904263 n=1 Tax=Tubulanus polymorphus TaxID=672921 RepID=UPI003DA424B9